MTSRFGSVVERRHTFARTCACALAALSFTLAQPSPLRAQVALDWQAPASCPQADSVREKVRALAGAAFNRAEPLHAEGIIEPNGESFRLTLRVRPGGDMRERVITSESCADLAGAAAVTLALLLKAGDDAAARDTNARAEHASNAERSAPARTGASQRARAAGEDEVERGSESDAAPNPASNAADWAMVVQLPVLALEHGPLPNPNLGGGLSVGVKYGSLRVLAGARAFLAQSLSSPTRARTGAEVRRMTGALVACRGFGGGALEVSPCLALTLERLAARGFGTGVAPRSQSVFSVAPGLELFAHLHAFERLAVFADAGARVEASRPRVVIEGVGEVAQLSSAAFSGSIGAEWIF